MRELIFKITYATPELQLVWGVWLLALLTLIVTTCRFTLKNYRRWRSIDGDRDLESTRITTRRRTRG